VFEVGAVADGVEFVAGKFPQQDAPEDLFVTGSDGAKRGGGPLVAVGADFENRWLRLPEAQDAEAEQAGLLFDLEHATDRVALVGPEVKHALAFAGNRVARSGEVEEQFTVFKSDGVGGVGEEGLEEMS
jgi:hypothetical protein